MSGKPTDYVAPYRQDVGEGLLQAALIPGGVLGEGRYRLLAQVGSDERCGAQLWRARDGALGRDVALTVLVGDRASGADAERARRALERSIRIGNFEHPGVARVLDVLSPGHDAVGPDNVLGIVVAEWTQGTDLADLVADGPLPAGTACRLLEPLAAAVESAHHSGLPLGVDHPQRIRVTPEGRIRLAFPAPHPEATTRDDVRGLGAAIYLLLTGRWAMPDSPAGLTQAPTGPDGTVVAPRTLRPSVPLELSTVAVRSLTDTSIGGLRTSAVVLRVLQETAVAETPRPAESGEATEEIEQGLWRTEDPKPDAERRRKLRAGLAALVVATLLVVGWLGLQLAGLFSGSSAHSPGPVVVNTTLPFTSTAPPSVAPTTPAPPPPVSGPLAFSAAKEWDESTSPDSPSKAGRVIDGDQSTSWNTDKYQQQLPALKSGIGIMLTVKDASKIASIGIDSRSAGTKVEIRAAQSASPDKVDNTQVIGSGTLNSGHTDIPVNTATPTKYVLVWITALSGSDGDFATAFSEITATSAP